jgi:hypothetical protein
VALFVFLPPDPIPYSSISIYFYDFLLRDNKLLQLLTGAYCVSTTRGRGGRIVDAERESHVGFQPSTTKGS